MSSLRTYAPRGRSAAIADAVERRRIERDLHDGAQNTLVAMRLKLGLAADRAAELGAPDLARRRLDSGEAAQAALDEVRSIAHGAVPPLLAVRGVVEALAAEGRRAAIPVQVVGRVPRGTPDAEAAVYYCCLEALQNAAKHAGPAARATVRLDCADGALFFAVLDDGAGFAPAEHGAEADGGLVHLRARVADAGGELTIASHPGCGTSVRGWVPWPARDVAAA